MSYDSDQYRLFMSFPFLDINGEYKNAFRSCLHTSQYSGYLTLNSFFTIAMIRCWKLNSTSCSVIYVCDKTAVGTAEETDKIFRRKSGTSLKPSMGKYLRLGPEANYSILHGNKKYVSFTSTPFKFHGETLN